MERLFNIDNPVWKFIGNIADMFFLSIMWYLSLIPLVTAGCGTTAVYYVTLKMTEDLEGRTIQQFFRSFKQNFKQTVSIWTPALLVLAILFIDINMALSTGSSASIYLTGLFIICFAAVTIFLSMLFPIIARCEDKTSVQLKNCAKICIQNPLASISVGLINIAMFLFGIFIFWPLLLIAPGLSAYLNSYVINHIFKKYSLNLE